MKLIIDIAMSRNSCHEGQNFAMNLWESDQYYISLFEKFQLSHDKHDIIHSIYIVMGHFQCNKVLFGTLHWFARQICHDLSPT